MDNYDFPCASFDELRPHKQPKHSQQTKNNKSKITGIFLKKHSPIFYSHSSSSNYYFTNNFHFNRHQLPSTTINGIQKEEKYFKNKFLKIEDKNYFHHNLIFLQHFEFSIKK